MLEVNVDGRSWGAVCDDGFNSAAAQSFCHDMGFSSWSQGTQYDTTHGSDSFALDDIICPSGADSVSDCHVSGHGAYSDNCSDGETVGIDCNPSGGHFETSGDCFSTDGGHSGTCIHSRNHMSGDSYENSEHCTATVHGSGTLHTVAFSTESCCDHLHVGGNSYSGSSGPSDQSVSDGDEITWSTDGSVTRTGWELCLR